MLTYRICFPLSDSLHPVWQSPGPSTSLQMAQFRSFTWLSSSPLLYMYYIFFIHFSVVEHIGCFCSHSLSSWLPKLCHSSFCVPDISGLLVLQSGISSMRWVSDCHCIWQRPVLLFSRVAFLVVYQKYSFIPNLLWVFLHIYHCSACLPHLPVCIYH